MPTERRASTSARPTSSTSAGRSRARSPAAPTSCDDAKGRFLANAAPASRKDARDAVLAARKAFGGWAGPDAVQPRAGALPGRRGARGPPRAVRRRGAARRGAHQAAGRDGRGRLAVDRLVWYAGWADKIAQVVGGTNPVAGPYFNFSLPEPTGVVAVVAPQGSSLLGLVCVVAPVIVTGNTCVVAASHDAAAAGDHAGRGAGHLRRARRRGQRAHRRRRPRSRRRWPRTWTSTRSTSPAWPATPTPRATSRSPPPTTSSGCCAPPPPSPTGPPSPGLDRMTRVPGDQDGLAPDRHLSRCPTRCRPGRRGGRTVRVRQVPALPPAARRPRGADGQPRRLLQGRRRPDACRGCTASRPGPRRLGRPGVLVLRGRAGRPGDAVPGRCRGHPGLRHLPRRPGRQPAARRSAGASYVVAEGLFAQEVVAGCRERGLLADAVCVRNHRLVTFWRRLTRDLREHRKPPLVLLRRGWLADAGRAGASSRTPSPAARPPMTPDEAFERLSGMRHAGRLSAGSRSRSTTPV